jgi:hypothetical protein
MENSEDEIGFERGRRRSSRLLAGFGRDLPTTTTTTLASLASSPSYRAPVRLLGEREREREREMDTKGLEEDLKQRMVAHGEWDRCVRRSSVAGPGGALS